MVEEASLVQGALDEVEPDWGSADLVLVAEGDQAQTRLLGLRPQFHKKTSIDPFE